VRRAELALLSEREGMQQMLSGSGKITLGKPLQEHQRPLRVLIEQRRGGGKVQDHGVAGLRLHRLFRQRQKPGRAFRSEKASVSIASHRPESPGEPLKGSAI
jgi:hypothetical protein